MINQQSNSTIKVNFQDIEAHLHRLRDECLSEIDQSSDSIEQAYLKATVDVLEGLERSIHRYCEEKTHFVEDEGHVFSPKSSEPWD